MPEAVRARVEEMRAENREYIEAMQQREDDYLKRKFARMLYRNFDGGPR